MENEILQYEKVIPLMGLLQVYILLQLVSLIVPLKLEGVQNTSNLKWENTRKDVGNTSAKKNSHQTSAYPTRSNHNSRLNQLKEGASKQRLTTIR